MRKPCIGEEAEFYPILAPLRIFPNPCPMNWRRGWESNPPRPAEQTDNGFEDRGGHQPLLTLRKIAAAYDVFPQSAFVIQNGTKKLRFQKDESEVRREITKSPRSANQWDKARFLSSLPAIAGYAIFYFNIAKVKNPLIHPKA